MGGLVEPSPRALEDSNDLGFVEGMGVLRPEVALCSFNVDGFGYDMLVPSVMTRV